MSVKYEIGEYEFRVSDFFPKEFFDEITDIRVNDPDLVLREAKARRRREKLTKDGKLVILATDHPARRVTRIRDDPLIMGDRYEYLGRVIRVLMNEEFDGVMGTTDFIEDLIIVNYIIKQNGGKSLLDDRVLIGSVNRGGFEGCVFEMDDAPTSFTPESIKEMNMDGGKFMYRLDPNDPASGKTVRYCVQVINRLNELGLYSFVEPLSVEKEGSKYKVKKDYATIIKDVSAAQALGNSSRRIWLKIPYCENFERVARATTLPILMLGGPAREDPTGTIEEFARGMRAGPNVRGVLVGRNVTFPYRDDPYAVSLAVSGIVHRGYDVDEAIRRLMENRGRDMDFLYSLL